MSKRYFGAQRRKVLTTGLAAAATMGLWGRSGAKEMNSSVEPGCWSPPALAAMRHGGDETGGVRTGGSRMVHLPIGYDVWVKQYASYNRSLPVLTLHGGPGLTHFYFECFQDFLPPAGIAYWCYDQLGCGFSDQPNDPRLWTIERFTSEVEAVRAALHLERMVLYGHSWGSMLAIEYALRHPDRLAGLIISNMTASIASCEKYILKLRSELPGDKLARLDALEHAHAYSSPEYKEIIDYLYHQHVCRLNPWPEPVNRAVKWLALPVYNTIQGKSEFEITGNMRGWDRWADLPKIRTPTLVLGARYDEINPKDVIKMARLIPGARAFICPNGSHLSMYDDQQSYFSALVPFLRSVSRATT